jgi:hypothetical protein
MRAKKSADVVYQGNQLPRRVEEMLICCGVKLDTVEQVMTRKIRCKDCKLRFYNCYKIYYPEFLFCVVGKEE